jgi:hypothetical protein
MKGSLWVICLAKWIYIKSELPFPPHRPVTWHFTACRHWVTSYKSTGLHLSTQSRMKNVVCDSCTCVYVGRSNFAICFNIKKMYIFHAVYLCLFHTIFRINKKYFHKQHQFVGFYNTDGACLFWVRNRNFKYYLD